MTRLELALARSLSSLIWTQTLPRALLFYKMCQLNLSQPTRADIIHVDSPVDRRSHVNPALSEHALANQVQVEQEQQYPDLKLLAKIQDMIVSNRVYFAFRMTLANFRNELARTKSIRLLTKLIRRTKLHRASLEETRLSKLIQHSTLILGFLFVCLIVSNQMSLAASELHWCLLIWNLLSITREHLRSRVMPRALRCDQLIFLVFWLHLYLDSPGCELAVLVAIYNALSQLILMMLDECDQRLWLVSLQPKTVDTFRRWLLILGANASTFTLLLRLDLNRQDGQPTSCYLVASLIVCARAAYKLMSSELAHP